MNASDMAVWNQTQDRLMSFIIRYTKDKMMAEDIVQDVFLKVHAKLGQLKESEKMTGWIFQIARNTITDYFRHKNKGINPADIDWEAERKPLNDCVSGCLLDMMSTLPEKYRNALELAELKNLSQLDLAKELSISYSGAKSRVQRGRQLLKKKMEEAYLIKFDAYGNVTVCENRVPCSCS